MPQYKYARLSTSEIRVSFLIFATSSLGLALYEYYLQSATSADLFEGFYFQRWPSEIMMQTVNVRVLREIGPLSFWYEKIFRRILRSDPILVLEGSRGALMRGLHRARIPTQDYTPNRLIETLPWVNLSRRLSGGPFYLAIIVFGTAGYLLAINYQLCEFRMRYLIIVVFIGLAFATIVVGSNRYSWTDGERLKFLIEAPVLLFSLHGIRLLIETLRVASGPRRRVND